MAQEEMEVDFETVPYPLGLPRIFSDSVSASHSEHRLPVEQVPHAPGNDYSNNERDNDVIVLDSVLVRQENVVASVRLLSEAIQQIGERSSNNNIVHVQQQPPERRNAWRQQRAARPNRSSARSHTPLDSYFQVNRPQTAAVAPPIGSVHLPENDEGNSSDATVELSDTDDDGSSAAETEEIEQASTGVPNVGDTYQ